MTQPSFDVSVTQTLRAPSETRRLDIDQSGYEQYGRDQEGPCMNSAMKNKYLGINRSEAGKPMVF